MKVKKEILSWAKSFVVSLIIVLLLKYFIVTPIRIVGNSMYPTLKNADYGISNIIGLKLHGIERFDIAIIHLNDREYIIKRVIGLPNEKVSYRNNKLYINDEYVEEVFLNGNITEDFEYKLSDNEYFCMGDNREHSSDSRYYGPFSKDMITSKNVLLIYPFDKIFKVIK